LAGERALDEVSALSPGRRSSRADLRRSRVVEPDRRRIEEQARRCVELWDVDGDDGSARLDPRVAKSTLA